MVWRQIEEKGEKENGDGDGQRERGGHRQRETARWMIKAEKKIKDQRDFSLLMLFLQENYNLIVFCLYRPITKLPKPAIS